MEIHTPKIIPGESEGGAGVFTTDYFGRVRVLCVHRVFVVLVAPLDISFHSIPFRSSVMLELRDWHTCIPKVTFERFDKYLDLLIYKPVSFDTFFRLLESQT